MMNESAEDLFFKELGNAIRRRFDFVAMRRMRKYSKAEFTSPEYLATMREVVKEKQQKRKHLSELRNMVCPVCGLRGMKETSECCGHGEYERIPHCRHCGAEKYRRLHSVERGKFE